MKPNNTPFIDIDTVVFNLTMLGEISEIIAFNGGDAQTSADQMSYLSSQVRIEAEKLLTWTEDHHSYIYGVYEAHQEQQFTTPNPAELCYNGVTECCPIKQGVTSWAHPCETR